jgi:hypothetical protein
MPAEQLHNIQIYCSPNIFKGIKSSWVRRTVILQYGSDLRIA